MAIPIQEDDLNGDGVKEAGETAQPMQTTSAPATPAAPGAAPPGNVPQWVQQFRTAQDARRNDFRSGMDTFYGGLGKMAQGDLQGGFGDWRAGHDQRRTDFRNQLNDRIGKLGERFQMPPGFASHLPWNRGQSGASGMGGTIAAGEPNPSAPGAPAAGAAPGQGPKQHGAWWAGGPKSSMRKPGRGGKQPKPAGTP